MWDRNRTQQCAAGEHEQHDASCQQERRRRCCIWSGVQPEFDRHPRLSEFGSAVEIEFVSSTELIGEVDRFRHGCDEENRVTTSKLNRDVGDPPMVRPSLHEPGGIAEHAWLNLPGALKDMVEQALQIRQRRLNGIIGQACNNLKRLLINYREHNAPSFVWSC